MNDTNAKANDLELREHLEFAQAALAAALDEVPR